MTLAETSQSHWDDDNTFELPSLQGLRVLVVDDDADARDAVRAVLEDSGAEVIAFSNASEALTEIKNVRPDVLVSDIAMPGMDGHKLMRRIRALDVERGGATPAAALTAYASVADRTRALLEGYQIYLSKPFEPAELVTLVANLAGRSSRT